MLVAHQNQWRDSKIQISRTLLLHRPADTSIISVAPVIMVSGEAWEVWRHPHISTDLILPFIIFLIIWLFNIAKPHSFFHVLHCLFFFFKIILSAVIS
jgi:hypothetical protein